MTKVALLAPPRPLSQHVLFLSCESFSKATDVLVRAKKVLGEILSAFEFLDRPSLEVTLKHTEGVRDPLPNARQEKMVCISFPLQIYEDDVHLCAMLY